MTKSLSDFWRTRRSYDKAIEMKTVLEDLKAFIEMAADEGDFSVTWGKRSQTNPDAKEVTLSYAPVAAISTPFSGEAVDVVAGFAVHEAGHRIRDQRGQSVRLLDDDERPDGMSVNVERAVRNLLEDVYIDHYLYVSKAPVLETYIKRGREWDKTQPKYAIDTDELKVKAQAEELSKLDVLKLWAKYELYGFNSADELKDFPDATLETLLNLAQITDTYCKKKGLVDAVAMYESIWDEMKGYGDPTGKPSDDGEKSDDSGEGGGENNKDQEGGDDNQQDDKSEENDGSGGGNTEGKQEEQKDEQGDGDNDEKDDEDQTDDSSGIGADEDEESDDESDDDDEDSSGDSDSTDEDELDDPFDEFLPCQDKSHQELPKDLEQSIEAAIMNDREDVTQDIIEEFKDEGFFDTMQDQHHSGVIVEKAAGITLPNQDDEVSRSIRQIFNFRKRRKTRYSRGTEEGTISQTRLYRAGMNSQHLYEKRDIKDSLDINICILVDMSSSVSNSQEILSQCVSSLALGLSHRRGVKVCALAYNTAGMYSPGNYSDADVSIYRLFETGDKEVRFVQAAGGTPSAAAIGAVPSLMRKLLGRANDNLLIHITDGFPHDEKLLHAYIEDLVEVLAKKHKIDTYCLAVMGYGAGAAGLPANQDNLLKKAYGDSYEKLNSYTDLPKALRKLLYNLLVAS